ncbi:MAG: hypothetical protein IKD61_08760, partial [Oscillospiraceae bacterium]|nr:hypothetical protein [Oscillospiraceae bacterium]
RRGAGPALGDPIAAARSDGDRRRAERRPARQVHPAENEYLRVSELVQDAIRVGDAEDSNKWLAAQDRLTKQILSLGDELGLNPSTRRARGLIAPRK